MGVKYWADTSAILHSQDIFKDKEILLSTLTLQELEHIKTKDRESEQVKFNARKAVKKIIEGKNLEVITSDNKKINKLLKKYPFLDDINDHRIICAAELYAMNAHEPVVFLTSDALQYLLAKRMPLIEAQYVEEATIEIDFNGWKEYHPNMDELTSLYADPTKNILNCKVIYERFY